MQDEGVIQEIRDRKHYTKPSEKRARAKAAGRARWLKKKREIDNR
jgi:ribosomal protein S21